GEVNYYNKNDALESRYWFLPRVGEDKQSEGGWTLGGPVYIPKVYDGRNKTFFFASMDIFRYVTTTNISGVSAVGTVPTVAERNGDFRELLGPQIGTDVLGRPIFKGEVYDPVTTRPDGQGGFIRDPFTYNGQLNVIDPARLSSISTFFQPGFATPTLPGVVNNWAGPGAQSFVDKDQ